MTTFATCLTPDGRGAIAVIAVCGSEADQMVARCFAPATPLAPTGLPMRKIRYGHWIGTAPQSNSQAAEGVIVVRLATHLVEVHCHGGRAAVSAILHDLAQLGAELATVEQFELARGIDPELLSLRAVLRSTNTQWTCALALAQLQGSLTNWAARLLSETASSTSSWDFEQVQAATAQVLARRGAAQHLNKPWQVVLAGPPNVGKSTLMNTLLGYQRSITFDQPGTTRDVITAESALCGWPVAYSDTAGIRAGDDPIEMEGTRRAQVILEAADLVLIVVDARSGYEPTHLEIAARTRRPPICVWNKSDLIEKHAFAPQALANSGPQPIPVVPTVATHVTGINHLVEAIEQALIPVELRQRPIDPDTLADTPLPVTPWQTELLETAHRATDLANWRAVISSLARPLSLGDLPHPASP